jgi:hypothetical protein
MTVVALSIGASSLVTVLGLVIRLVQCTGSVALIVCTLCGVVAKAALGVLRALWLVHGLSTAGSGVTVVRNVLNTTGARAGTGQVDVLIIAVLTGVRLEDVNQSGGWLASWETAVAVVADYDSSDSCNDCCISVGYGRDECGRDCLDIRDSGAGFSEGGTGESDDFTRLSDDGTRLGNNGTRLSDCGAGQSDCVAIGIGRHTTIDGNVNGEKDIASHILASGKAATAAGRCVSTTTLDIIARAFDITLVIVDAVSTYKDISTVARAEMS